MVLIIENIEESAHKYLSHDQPQGFLQNSFRQAAAGSSM